MRNTRTLERKERKKSQLSLELLVVLAGYIALIGAIAAFERDLAVETRNVVEMASAEAEAEANCFVIDFFALNARNTDFRLGANKALSASGHELAVKRNGVEGRAVCRATMRSEQGLKVKQSAFEQA